METLNAKIYNSTVSRYYTGSEYKDFFYQNSATSYTKTIANGTYHYEGMTYLLSKIKDNIGWEPFMQTYRYFNRLGISNCPTSRIDKFNLFISALKYYSNFDVLTLLSYTDKQVIGNYYGGTVSYVEKPEWYHFNTYVENVGNVEIYLSDIGGSNGDNLETVKAIFDVNNESVWKEYTLVGDVWYDTGSTYAYNPIGGGGTTLALSSNMQTMASPTEIQMALSFNLSTKQFVKDIQNSINTKKEELLNKLYAKIGFDPTTLTNDQKELLADGVVISIDDNLYFGLVQKLLNKQPPNDNYYFMRAKAFTDAVFCATYTVAMLGSAVEAANALTRSGISGSFALATAETGVGGVAFGAVAVSELAEAGAMTGVSFLSAKMAQRSQGLLQSSTAKLSQTTGYKIRNVADDILDVMEGPQSHTIALHVSMTNQELIYRAISEAKDATSYLNKSTAIKCVQQNLRRNADIVEEWLKNSNNNPLKIICNHEYSIGYGARSGMNNITYGLMNSQIYMVRDSTLSLGFRIITSYPIF